VPAFGAGGSESTDPGGPVINILWYFIGLNFTIMELIAGAGYMGEIHISMVFSTLQEYQFL